MSFIDNQNFIELKKQYRIHPIILYLGAGATLSREDQYGLGGWNGLIENILMESNTDHETISLFKNKIKTQWENEPWKIADWVVEVIDGVERFQNLVAKVIEKVIVSNKNKYGRILPGFLNNAPTLNAITAFCGKIKNLVSYNEVSGSIKYHITRNERVSAIVTSNYDPFLQLSASAMFQKPMLHSMSTGKIIKNFIPVYHIHGYVPPPEKGFLPFLPKHLKEKVTNELENALVKKSSELKAFINPILTTKDYKAAWDLQNIFSTTLHAQIQYLRYYPTLFIGFSFRDQWINNLLNQLKTQEKRRNVQHFALLHQDEIQSKGQDFFDSIGINPIPLHNFKELPNLLGLVYQEGIIKDYGKMGPNLHVKALKQRKRKNKQKDRSMNLNPQLYWQDLLACRESAVRRTIST